MEEKYKDSGEDIIEEGYSLLSFKLKQLTEKNEIYSQKSTLSSIGTKKNTSKGSLVNTSIDSHNASHLEDTTSLILSNLLSLPVKNGQKVCTLLNKSSFSKKTCKEVKKKRNLTIYHEKQQQKDYNDYVTLRFMKKTQKQESRHIEIYQVALTSVLQIAGEGVLILSNGITMEGNWYDGQAVSPLKIRYQDKSQYQGEVYKLKAHGLGTLSYPSGCKFVGEFCDGDPHGEGILFDQNGKLIRVGEWKRGIFLQ